MLETTSSELKKSLNGLWLSRENNKIIKSYPALLPGGGGGGDFHMEWTGMFVVSLRGVNFGFWSRLGCSGQNVIIFSPQGLVKCCTQRNNKTERILILYIYSIHINKFAIIKSHCTFCLFHKLVSFRGLHKLRPRPDWSLLGVKFKISDEHPCPLHMGVPPSGHFCRRSLMGLNLNSCLKLMRGSGLPF